MAFNAAKSLVQTQNVIAPLHLLYLRGKRWARDPLSEMIDILLPQVKCQAPRLEAQELAINPLKEDLFGPRPVVLLLLYL